MRIVKLEESSRRNLLELILKRSPSQYGTFTDKVNEIVETVREKRDEALFAYTEKFDGCKVNKKNVQVTEE